MDQLIEEVYTVNDGSRAFCTRMEMLRQANYVPDLTIKGFNGEAIFAHKITLATRFPSLQDILSQQPSGAVSSMEWSQISGHIIEQIVSYAYSGTITITSANALQIYLMAICLQDQPLREFCQKVLIAGLSFANMSATLIAAIETANAELKAACMKCLQQNFLQLRSAPLLALLDPTTVTELLQARVGAPNKSEECKLQLLDSWVSIHKGTIETELLEKMLATISFDRINDKLMVKYLLSDSKLMNLYCAREWIQSAREKKQSSHEGIFLTGKKAGNKYLIIKYHPETREEAVLGNFPYRTLASLASVGDCLYLVGGYDHKALNWVDSFNVANKTYLQRTNMNVARYLCAVASSRKNILVCGGQDSNGMSLNSCELYESRHDRWITMPNLNMARQALQVIWLQDGRIFAIGGYNAKKKCQLDSVEMVTRQWELEEVSGGVWRAVAPMLTRRSIFGAVSIDNFIIVAGGYNNDTNPLGTVELFTLPPANDNNALGSWTFIQPMKSSMKFHSGAVFHNAVFMFGENNQIQKFATTEDDDDIGAKKFATWTWSDVEDLRSVNDSIRGAVFK